VLFLFVKIVVVYYALIDTVINIHFSITHAVLQIVATSGFNLKDIFESAIAKRGCSTETHFLRRQEFVFTH
jgi:hypothetical protein